MNVFVCCLCTVCMYRMTNGRLEVRIFFLFKRTIPLPVEVIRPILILLNYRLRLVPQCVLRLVHIADARTFCRHERVVTNSRMWNRTLKHTKT